MRSQTKFIQVPLLAGLLLMTLTLPSVSRAEDTQTGGFVLQGNVLRVGVSDSGGLINDEPCDTNFDDPDCVGIDYDRTGTATWTAWDFLKPGAPFEFFSVGYRAGTGQEPSWQAAGYSSGNNFNATSTDTSTGSILSAQTIGNFNNELRIEHNLYFQENSGIINFTTTLTNESTDQLTDVVFARGLDPDQDSYYDSGSTDPNCDGRTSDTENSIHLPALVTARGICTDWTIGLRDLSGDGVPTVSPYWEENPYLLFDPGLSDGVSGEDGFSNYRDDTINLAWRKATLDPGESWTLRYQYIIDESFVGVTQLNINTQTLPSAPVNETYTTYIEAVGGVLPYTWSIIDKTPSAIVALHPDVATMLDNLSIDPETGKLTWIDLPALVDAPGIYIDFTVQVMDNNGDTATATFRYTDPVEDSGVSQSGNTGGAGGLGWPLLAMVLIVMLRRRG